jgi:hypothetical protein
VDAQARQQQPDGGGQPSLMQSVLGPACMLMGHAMRFVPSGRNQGRAGTPRPRTPDNRKAPARDGPDSQSKWCVRLLVGPKMSCLRTMVAMAILLLTGTPRSMAFKAFDCNNGSAPIEQYLLLDPEPSTVLELQGMRAVRVFMLAFLC